MNMVGTPYNAVQLSVFLVGDHDRERTDFRNGIHALVFFRPQKSHPFEMGEFVTFKTAPLAGL